MRLEYLSDCYVALGMTDSDAQLWSTFAYATFIGNQQVHRDTPDRFPSGAQFSEYFKLMIKTLIPKGVQSEEMSHPNLVELPKKRTSPTDKLATGAKL